MRYWEEVYIAQLSLSWCVTMIFGYLPLTPLCHSQNKGKARQANTLLAGLGVDIECSHFFLSQVD